MLEVNSLTYILEHTSTIYLVVNPYCKLHWFHTACHYEHASSCGRTSMIVVNLLQVYKGLFHCSPAEQTAI